MAARKTGDGFLSESNKERGHRGNLGSLPWRRVRGLEKASVTKSQHCGVLGKLSGQCHGVGSGRTWAGWLWTQVGIGCKEGTLQAWEMAHPAPHKKERPRRLLPTQTGARI